MGGVDLRARRDEFEVVRRWSAGTERPELLIFAAIRPTSRVIDHGKRWQSHKKSNRHTKSDREKECMHTSVKGGSYIHITSHHQYK